MAVAPIRPTSHRSEGYLLYGEGQRSASAVATQGVRERHSSGFKWRNAYQRSMAARFCARCGQPIPPGGSFCSSCGAAVAPRAGPATPPGALLPPPPPGPTAYAPYPPYPGLYVAPGGSFPTFGPADRAALSDVYLAAVLGLVSVILAIIELFRNPAVSIAAISTVGTGTSVTVNLAALELVAAAGGASLVLLFLELWFYRRAFRSLAPQDPRFSTPATLTLLLFVGLILLLAAALGFLVVIYQAIQCAGAGNAITSACIDAGTVLGLLAVLGIGGLIALVGFIGLLIGIWRLGTRYNEDMFKVGAVFLIFPVLNVIGVILILLATRAAQRKLESVTLPATFG